MQNKLVKKLPNESELVQNIIKSHEAIKSSKRKRFVLVITVRDPIEGIHYLFATSILLIDLNTITTTKILHS